MKTAVLLFAAALCLIPLDTPSASASDHHAKVLLSFASMYGVDGPFVGETNPIRGIPGDGLPWEIAHVRGALLTDGTISVLVRGLVFPNDPAVPPELRGINDEEQFRAGVSCLTEDGDNVVTANVFTPGFRATRSGNSFIFSRVKLPSPCVAPIVFIVSGEEDDWLAVTGVETD